MIRAIKTWNSSPAGSRRLQRLSLRSPILALRPPDVRTPNYSAAVRRSAIWLAVVAAAGAAFGLGSVHFRSPLYAARTVLEIVPQNESFLGLAELRRLRMGASAGRHDDLDTHVELLRSPGVSSPVGQRLEGTFLSLVNEIELARRNLRVRPMGRGRLIELVSQSTSPEAAARFTNELARRYIESRESDRVTEAEGVRKLLEIRAEQARGAAESAKLRAARFAHSHGLDADLSRRDRDLEDEIVGAITLGAQARARRDSGLTDTESSDEYRRVVADLDQRRATLLATLTPRHPAVVRVDAEIDAANEALRDAEQRSIRSLDGAVATSEQRNSLLATRREIHRRRLFDNATQRLRLEQLRHEAQFAEAAADSAMREAKLASLATSLTDPGIRIVEFARPASKPTRVDQTTAAAAGALLAGMSCLGIVIVRAHSDDRIRTPRDLPAVIADRSYRSHGKARIKHTDLGSVPFFAGAAPSGAGRLELATESDWSADRRGPVATPLEFLDRRAQRGRVWCSLATSLVLADPSPRLIAVTSAGRSDGRTTVTLGLARALSEVGWKVLIVDSTARYPAIHQRLGLPLTPGLGEFLKAGANASAAGATIHVVAESPGLFAISAGDPANALPTGIDRFVEFATECRRKFDYVLVDAPEISAGADARVPARFADAVVLVARAGRTTAADIGGSIDELSRDGVRRVFTVLNGYGRPRFAGGKSAPL